MDIHCQSLHEAAVALHKHTHIYMYMTTISNKSDPPEIMSFTCKSDPSYGSSNFIY
jgi:hypothetical protein